MFQRNSSSSSEGSNKNPRRLSQIFDLEDTRPQDDQLSLGGIISLERRRLSQDIYGSHGDELPIETNWNTAGDNAPSTSMMTAGDVGATNLVPDFDLLEESKMTALSSRKPGRRGRKPTKVDQKTKLERSRQSARECRARKKLRYQYLEELVSSREKAIYALRREMESFKIVCGQLDKGHISPSLEQFVARDNHRAGQPSLSHPTPTSRKQNTNRNVKGPINKPIFQRQVSTGKENDTPPSVSSSSSVFSPASDFDFDFTLPVTGSLGPQAPVARRTTSDSHDHLRLLPSADIHSLVTGSYSHPGSNITHNALAQRTSLEYLQSPSSHIQHHSLQAQPSGLGHSSQCVSSSSGAITRSTREHDYSFSTFNDSQTRFTSASSKATHSMQNTETRVRIIPQNTSTLASPSIDARISCPNFDYGGASQLTSPEGYLLSPSVTSPVGGPHHFEAHTNNAATDATSPNSLPSCSHIVGSGQRNLQPSVPSAARGGGTDSSDSMESINIDDLSELDAQDIEAIFQQMSSGSKGKSRDFI